MYNIDANNIGFAVNGFETFRINRGLSPAQLRASDDGSTSRPSYSFQSDTNTGMYLINNDGRLGFSANNQEMFRIDNGALEPRVVVNEGGADIDFRVEGNSEVNLLFTNAGTDRVGIKTASPETTLQIGVTGDASDQLSVPEGSNTAPAYTFIDHLDTGMYFETGNQLSFSAGGERMLTLDRNATSSSIEMYGNVNGTLRNIFDFDGAFGITLNLEKVNRDFQVRGGTQDNVIRVDAANDNVGISRIPGSFALDVSGNVRCTSGAACTSDARVKGNIQDLEHGLDFVNILQPRSFTMTGSEGVMYGFIAQEVGTALGLDINEYNTYGPYAHGEEASGINPFNIPDYYALVYDQFIPINTKAIQELNAIVETQQTTIDTQQGTIDAQNQQIHDLEAHITSILQRLDDLESNGSFA